MEQVPKLKGLNEAAAQLGISPAGLKRALGRGELTAVKLGRRTLVAEAELIRFVANLPVRRAA